MKVLLLSYNFVGVFDLYKGKLQNAMVTPIVICSDGSDDDDNYGPLKKKVRMGAGDATAVNEIKLYLEALPMASTKADPLEWWNANKDILPILSSIAKDYLAVQSSSVASERAFSSARQTCTDNRACLSTESMQATQCLKSWGKMFDQ